MFSKKGVKRKLGKKDAEKRDEEIKGQKKRG